MSTAELRSALSLVSACCVPLWPELCEQEAWAQVEFGHAQLGDARRSRRLVSITERAVLQPAAAITQICANLPREMDAAYDFFENDKVSAVEIARAHNIATARRAQGFDFIFYAIDGSSFLFPDAEGVGRVGSNNKGGKGIKSMFGFAVSPSGIPLGLLGQRLWARGRKATKHRHCRSLDQKETMHWHDVLGQGLDVMAEHAPGVKLWAQLDREGDSWTLLLRAVTEVETHWTTIRAKANRTLVADPDGQDETEPGGKLFDALERAEVGATWQMDVPGSSERQARTANMHLRWVEVTLKLTDQRTKEKHPAQVFALLAEEVGTAPPDEKPLRWLLLTTYPIKTAEDACLVLHGYSLRWRIEGLHAALKERGCKLEDSELQTRENLERFVAVMLAVAARLMRVVYLGRVCGDQLAHLEFSKAERLAMLLAHERDPADADTLTLGEAVVLLGKLGGHVGNPTKRPIGFKVLARGMKELRPWVRMVQRGMLARR